MTTKSLINSTKSSSSRTRGKQMKSIWLQKKWNSTYFPSFHLFFFAFYNIYNPWAVTKLYSSKIVLSVQEKKSEKKSKVLLAMEIFWIFLFAFVIWKHEYEKFVSNEKERMRIGCDFWKKKLFIFLDEKFAMKSN